MRILPFLVISLVGLGVVYRLWPLLTGMPYLSTFFIIEDGYITLTVARNIAIGLGMTVSDGTIQTNGVQPLSTFLFTLPYVALGGDKVASLYVIHLMLAGFGIGVLFAIRAFVRLMLPDDTHWGWPWAVGLLWFLGPLLLRHSMNGLETGLYTLFVLVLLLLFARVLAGDAVTNGQRLMLGAFCGLTVLARIDAVFLVTALFLVWAADELFTKRSSFATMLARLVPPGLLSLLVTAPWFVTNYLRFGSIMPISGTSQSHLTSFGSNAEWVPVKLFETMVPMLPIPRAFERTLFIQIGGSAVVVLSALVLAVVVWRHSGPVARKIGTVYGLFAISLAVYYGLFFGAPHFLGRYFAPLAPLLILAGVVTARATGTLLGPVIGRALAPAYVGLGMVLCLALLGRALMPGVTKIGHEQVLAWTAENVPQEAWVAAAQTGVLGYWHDRTINLDGKTNINALQAHWRDGHILNYVVESPADYVVDWAPVAAWIRQDVAQESLAGAFEIVVEDFDTNLGVLQRIAPRYHP